MNGSSTTMKPFFDTKEQINWHQKTAITDSGEQPEATQQTIEFVHPNRTRIEMKDENKYGDMQTGKLGGKFRA